jgi:hypothetical protein
MKMEQTERSETLAFKLQTPVNRPQKAYDIQNRAKVWIRVCYFYVQTTRIFLSTDGRLLGIVLEHFRVFVLNVRG